MGILIIDHCAKVTDRIEAAKKNLPYHVHIDPMAVYVHDSLRRSNGLLDMPLNKEEYFFQLFEFPKGTSKKMASYRMHRYGYEPANPAHMLAFAEQAFKDNNSFGKWHSYVIGLGGELQTVLGAQFGGPNFGMCYFFQHLPQNAWTHDGGEDNRFLGVCKVGS